MGVEALVRCLMRPPVSLGRLRLLLRSDEVLHFPMAGGDDPGSAQPERIDSMEYVARVPAQIPPPRKHLVRYHGFYSNAARGKRRCQARRPTHELPTRASDQYTARFWTFPLVARLKRVSTGPPSTIRAATYSPSAGPCLKP